MLKKLKWKFVAVTMAIMTVMLCLILALVLYFTRASLERESYQRLQAAASSDFRPGKPGQGSGGDVLTVVFTSRGELLITGTGHYDLTDLEYLTTITQSALEGEKTMGELPQYGLRYYRERTPTGIRVSFADTAREAHILEDMAWGSLAIGLVSLLGIFGISVLLARWMIGPVETAWQAQKEFVADASHELKTPLTVITTNAELLQQPERSSEEKDKFSANILTMAQRMRHLVEGMLELARGDNASLKLDFQNVDLSGLAEEACLVFEPMAYERELSLHSQIQPGIAVRGSREHLSQVVQILLDNALKYSTTPGTIALGLQQHGSFCQLWVENPGEEISREQREKIFRRFYRGDKARTGGSFGLGLPIAQTIVDAHGGKIWVDGGSGINRFTVQLPIQ